VVGYTGLYLELELKIFPEVHIAEEARGCVSNAIFDAITANPIKYTVMDDYVRSINIANLWPASLNGDIAMQPSLEITNSA